MEKYYAKEDLLSAGAQSVGNIIYLYDADLCYFYVMKELGYVYYGYTMIKSVGIAA